MLFPFLLVDRTAHYYNFKDVKDIAWYYPDPKEKAAEIKGFVAFYVSKVPGELELSFSLSSSLFLFFACLFEDEKQFLILFRLVSQDSSWRSSSRESGDESDRTRTTLPLRLRRRPSRREEAEVNQKEMYQVLTMSVR